MTEQGNLPIVAELLPDKNGQVTQIVINQGASDGVKVGEIYLIYGIGKEILDPVTGKSLGKLELVRGRAKVTLVQEFMATLTSIETKKGTSTTKKISRQDGSYGFLFPQQETITELGEPSIRELDGVARGDFARKTNP